MTRPRRWRRRLRHALRWVLFAVVVAVLNLPLAITVATSLKSDAAINASPPVWLFRPVARHYAAVLGDASLDFLRYLVNSTVIAGGGTTLALLLAVPAAYAVVRSGVGSRALVPLMAVLRAVPLVVFAIPFYLMYQTLGLLDTRLGLALISCVINLPLSVLVSIGAIRDLPVEIEEAACLDGAGTVRILLAIVTPLLRPALTATAILGFITSWNEFLFGLILSTRRAVPVTVAATFFTTTWGVRWGDTAAAMTLSLAPPVVLGLLSYRSLGRVLAAGAVKG